MGALGDLFGSSEFQLGLVLGVVAGCIVVGLHLMLPSVRPRRRGLVGRHGSLQDFWPLQVGLVCRVPDSCPGECPSLWP